MPTNPPVPEHSVDPKHPTDPSNRQEKQADNAHPHLASEKDAGNSKGLGSNAHVVSGSGILTTRKLKVGGKRFSILVPTYAPNSDEDSTLESPPSSVHDFPKSSTTVAYHSPREKMSGKSRTSLSAAAQQLAAPAVVSGDMPVPADMFAYLVSPECTFSAKEKAYAYKNLLKASVLAYDPANGVSRFSWAYNRISALDERAKAEAMLHSDHTIASVCNAFFSYLREAESVENMADGLFTDSGAINRSLIESMLDQEREHVVESKKKGTSSTATTKPSKSEVEKLRVQLSQKEREISNKKTEISIKKTEIQNLQQKLVANKIQITKLQDERDKAQDQNAQLESQRNAFANEATEMREKWTQADVKLQSMDAEMRLVTERCDNMTKLISEICSRHELILDVVSSQLRGSEENLLRLKQDVGGLQQTIVEQASKIEQVETKLEKTETELEREKKDLTLARECMAGDQEALACVRLRSLLDRMKLDLCGIAKIPGLFDYDRKRYSGPIEYHAAQKGFTIIEASMDIFCKARLKIESARENGTLERRLKGYAKLFLPENFHASFDLIFSDASELRHIANKKAHQLPLSAIKAVQELIDEACPEDEKRITTVCFEALELFKPLHLRVAAQKEQNEEALAGLHEKKGDQPSGKRWKELNEWWMVKVRGQVKGSEKLSSADTEEEEEDEEDEEADAAKTEVRK